MNCTVSVTSFPAESIALTDTACCPGLKLPEVKSKSIVNEVLSPFKSVIPSTSDHGVDSALPLIPP